VLTRTAVRSSPMPEGEDLARFAPGDATLAIHLSVANLEHVVAALVPHRGGDCPVVVAVRVGWDDQQMIHGTLGDIAGKVAASGVARTALILVGRALAGEGFDESRLYDAGHDRAFRPKD
jgi:precorrin-4/cobalt-precorrin-4 C11-methyltransferase